MTKLKLILRGKAGIGYWIECVKENIFCKKHKRIFFIGILNDKIHCLFDTKDEALKFKKYLETGVFHLSNFNEVNSMNNNFIDFTDLKAKCFVDKPKEIEKDSSIDYEYQYQVDQNKKRLNELPQVIKIIPHSIMVERENRVWEGNLDGVIHLKDMSKKHIENIKEFVYSSTASIETKYKLLTEFDEELERRKYFNFYEYWKNKELDAIEKQKEIFIPNVIDDRVSQQTKELSLMLVSALPNIIEQREKNKDNEKV